MIPKNKIRLSRNLRAQTRPYPNVRRLFKKGLLFLLIILIFGIYTVASNSNTKQKNLASESEKQVLGEQQNSLIFQTYQVKEGDTLFNISTRYSVDWKNVVELNDLNEPYTLKIGQELKIPQ